MKMLKTLWLALVLAFTPLVAFAADTTIDEFQTRIQEAVDSGELKGVTQQVLVGANAQAYVSAYLTASGVVDASASSVVDEVILLTADNKEGVGVFVVVDDHVLYLGILSHELHDKLLRQARN